MKLDDIRRLSQKLGSLGEPRDVQKLQELLREMGIDPGSFYQELEMSSRYVDTHRDVSWSNASVSLHSHSFYEILYCRNTCGAEYLVESVRYQLQKGDIILVPPGISHRPLLPEHMTEPYRRDVLWISGEFLGMLRQVFPPEPKQKNYPRVLRTSGTRWEYLGDLFRTGVEEFEGQEPGWEAAVLGNTTHLMAHLRRAVLDQSAHPPKAEKPDLVERVLAYVEGNLAERITLADAARQFYVSESTISQSFRKKMGVSFYRCVTQRRLIAAKTLIGEGVLLEDVAGKVGFSDYSSFYRAFKQEYGISPRQYRNLQTQPPVDPPGFMT